MKKEVKDLNFLIDAFNSIRHVMVENGANIFFQIGTIIIIATAFAYLAKLLKQPLIPAYVLAGILIGPVFGLITNTEAITTLSEIGIAFLLFIVGLEIDLRKLKDVGMISSLGCLIQVLSIFSVTFIVSVLLGFLHKEAIYLGLIIAFSSTMVVVKLLSDKREIDTLHGRIILGILLMQDIIAILVLSVLTTIDNFSILVLLLSIFKGIIVFLIAAAASKFVFPWLFEFAAKSKELLFISAVSISFIFSLLFSSMGFSIAIGAFVAGVTLANLPYNIEIIGRVKPLRDFFSVIFFVSLGMELFVPCFDTMWKAMLLFIVLIIVLKPMITMFLCAFFGYKRRTAFLTSISLAQISEFSLIIVAQGFLLGHVSNEIFSLTVILAVITIVLTSYFIKYEDKIYLNLSSILEIFDRITGSYNELEYVPRKRHEVVLCGYNRIGYSIFKTLKKLRKKLLVIDFNPEVIRKFIDDKVPCIYGDVGDIEVIERMNLKYAKMVISTVPTKTDNLLLIRQAKKENRNIIVFVTANHVDEALELYDAGADYVILPHFLGGDHVSLLLEDFTEDLTKIIKTKIEHIKELHKRKSLGHKHPANKLHNHDNGGN